MPRNGHKKSAMGAVAPSDFRSPNLVAELAATAKKLLRFAPGSRGGDLHQLDHAVTLHAVSKDSEGRRPPVNRFMQDDAYVKEPAWKTNAKKPH